ncbi:MAG: RNA 2',3'-cyclic phosphodiesterase [Candidatus Portnoybacteria bacterium]|nr:RNA 2',3'-cyclic phosphodiesterase [Candidatus Portnoybacteria bacterium]
MKKRVFIAINLSEKIKNRLLEFKEKWNHLPVRWTKKDSLHLTLVFIGYVTDDELYNICKIINEVARRHEPFYLEFERVLYGPPDKPPRMIWLKGKISEELADLRSDLETALSASENAGGYSAERRPFSPHISLARINMEEWHKLVERPNIEENFKFGLNAASIEVMQSDLKRSGAEYAILESCPLGE